MVYLASLASLQGWLGQRSRPSHVVCIRFELTSYPALIDPALMDPALVDPALYPPVIGKKRAYEPSDENIDPMLFFQSKKTKLSLDEIKPPFSLTPATNTSTRRKLPLPKNRQSSITKPSHPTFSATPAPAEVKRVPFGRSPVKPHGLVSRRRKTARINPPNFPNGSGPGPSPISLDHALSGTVESYAPSVGTPKNTPPNNGSAPMLDGKVRKGWSFEIHEDSEDEEKENLLQHSAFRMDISDDEGSAAKDDRGKENIPPTDDMFVPPPINTTVPFSRKNMMTDEPRTPLGDLIASEFYGEGLDVDSVFIIPADQGEEVPLDDANCKNQPQNNAAVGEPINYWKDLLADLEASKKVNSGASCAPIKEEIPDEAAHFDIWESESSKGEDDVQVDSKSRPVAVAPNAE